MGALPSVQADNITIPFWALNDYGTKDYTPSLGRVVISVTSNGPCCDVPGYGVLVILFADGTAFVKPDAIGVWEVAKVAPTLYFLSVILPQRGLIIYAVDLRARHVTAPLTVRNAFATSLRCGLVFKVGQQHFTLRPSAETGEQVLGPNDYGHALVRGISTCN